MMVFFCDLKDIVGIDDAFQSGDLVWVETPLNPLGEARNIKHYADRVGNSF